jgi:hypothetical protein
VGSDLDGVEEAADGLFVHGVGGEELLQAVAEVDEGLDRELGDSQLDGLEALDLRARAARSGFARGRRFGRSGALLSLRRRTPGAPG